jgi:hypothetical protein
VRTMRTVAPLRSLALVESPLAPEADLDADLAQEGRRSAQHSRGSARNGAVLGSSSALRIPENVDFAEPCSPESTITG